jgi:lipopolysaccharide/colanic/teichoic acid biosynthesis glycosyltransferase
MPNNYLVKERYYWLKVLLDGIFLAIGFLTVYWFRRGTLVIDAKFRPFLTLMFALWLLATLLSKKFKHQGSSDYFKLLRPYWLGALVFVLLLTFVIFILGWIDLSRLIIYGGIGVYLLLETLYLAAYMIRIGRREKTFRVPFAVFFFFSELLALTASFYALYFSRRSTLLLEEKYQIVLLALFFTWLLVSFLMHRFHVSLENGIIRAFIPFWQAEGLVLGMVSFYIFVFGHGELSRLIVFGSLAMFGLFENIVVLSYYIRSRFGQAAEEPAPGRNGQSAQAGPLADEKEDTDAFVRSRYIFPGPRDADGYVRRKLERLFLKKFQDINAFIGKYVDLDHFDILSSLFLYSAETWNIEILEDASLSFFFNLEKVNNFRHVNRVFIEVNRKLLPGGVIVGCFESFAQRRERIFARFPHWLARIYYVFDFIYKRIMPKLPLLKKVYFFMSRGKKRVFSRTEVLGRLLYCGFDVIGLNAIDGLYYFIAKKCREPRTDPRPSYGPVFRQRRLGKGGKVLFIYKLRTMHPFAEYLHQYILERNRLEESGKIARDFRITEWGRFFRKTWIDELPMLVNWLKGDLKLVGVRPLSETFFKSYPEDLQKERLQFKPGLVPPYYADMPQGIEKVWESERRYLEKYRAHPMRTDFIYFFRAFNNIVFHHAKSS